jgi:hypothetical protein
MCAVTYSLCGHSLDSSDLHLALRLALLDLNAVLLPDSSDLNTVRLPNGDHTYAMLRPERRHSRLKGPNG